MKQLKTLTTSPKLQLQRFSLLRRRGLLFSTKAFLVLVVLSCTVFGLAKCEFYGLESHKLLENNDCGLARCELSGNFDGNDVDPADRFFSGSPLDKQRLGFDSDSVCKSSLSFCFPSTLPGFLDQKFDLTDDREVSGSRSDVPSSVGSTESSNLESNKSWSSDNGMFKLFNGGIVSCSLISKEATNEFSSIQTDSANQNDISSRRGPLLYQKSTSFRVNKAAEMTKPNSFGGSSLPYVEITPAVLDWGKKYTYSPSVAFLTLENTCNDDILHVYEPFSTDLQFYPCNFSEVVLRPGEITSICFVFLPRWLGLSSAHIVLQTSFGGFLIQAKGFSIESPYGIHPLSSLNVSLRGRWRNSFSLYNSVDQHVHVEEVTVWISVSLEHTSHYAEAACSTRDQGSNVVGEMNIKDRLVVSTGQVGLPLLEMKPLRNWEIGPRSSETFIEIDFSTESSGKIFGAVCMQLLRSSQDKPDTFMLPFEVEVGQTEMNDALGGPIVASLEVLHPRAGNEAVVAISLKNCAPYILKVLEVTEIADCKIFQIKRNEGLLLFPGTDTYVAVIACTDLHVEDGQCRLLILTNDSSSSQIEVPCEDVVHICSTEGKCSPVKYEHQAERSEPGDLNTMFSDSSIQLPSESMATDRAVEADELVLRNWKSHDISLGMSVLDDHEVLFPMVQVGSHHSMWVNVKNPSQEPVVMQLILNSGEIIDQCKSPDGLMQSSSPSRHGFSIAESGLTEAFVLPNGRASLGPLVFHPSNRCEWKSSALIRNNLSGVEWLHIRGNGGSLTLLLFEESEPIQSVELNLNLPIPLNISSPDLFVHLEDTTRSCLQPLSKELYAKNTGDMPLEVTELKVSGIECGIDGFWVHPCKGFYLQPGESTKLLISYQTDFSTPLVRRDLELALATGILVMPMKAHLPLYMLNSCRKSVFWTRFRKYSAVVFLVGSLIFLVLWGLFSLDAPTNVAGKSSDVHSCRNFKLSMSCETGSLLRSFQEDRTLMQTSEGGYSQKQAETLDRKKSDNRANHLVKVPKQTQDLSDKEKNTGQTVSLISESTFHENSVPENSELGNLIVKTGKEKGRKRRKRKSTGSKLAGLLEVSSSQSGNSTPSSPMSPVTSVIPKQTRELSPDVGRAVDAKIPFTHTSTNRRQKSRVSKFASEENLSKSEVSLRNCNSHPNSPSQSQPSAPKKTLSRPILLPLATFPCSSKPTHLVETSGISPHARAPGYELYERKNVVEVKPCVGDEYTYDIWGDHFPRILLGRSKDTNRPSSNDTESDPDSFFVKDPQTFMANSLPSSDRSNANAMMDAHFGECKHSQDDKNDLMNHFPSQQTVTYSLPTSSVANTFDDAVIVLCWFG